MTNEEIKRNLVRQIALNAIKLDERTTDEKLDDLEVKIEDFKDRRADEEVERLVDEAKKEGGINKAMFEDPEEEKAFSWEEIGEID